MKIIATLLWCQVALGVLVAFLAWGHIFSAAMGMESSRRLQRDFEQLRQSPTFQEPPQVRGISFARLVEDRYPAARERGHAGMLAFITGLAASLLAGILLWLLGRVQQRAHEHTTLTMRCSEPGGRVTVAIVASRAPGG